MFYWFPCLLGKEGKSSSMYVMLVKGHYYEKLKEPLQLEETPKYWFSFVLNNSTSSLKLQLLKRRLTADR